jgi:hypothetical protein
MGNRASHCFREQEAGKVPVPKAPKVHVVQTINVLVHKVCIQDLDPPRKQMIWGSKSAKPDIPKFWTKQKCSCRRNGGACMCEVLSCYENCRADFQGRSNAFFGAFLEAYNHHQDILLAPDDVWLVVCLQFSKYVNANAEKLRDKLVLHEGQKKLTVTTHVELSESEWGEFFAKMQVEIARNTKAEIVDTLQSDFSTTGVVEKMISAACVMDSFKKFFSYGRCIALCGIRNACFLGTADDWERLMAKTGKLKTYDIDGTWNRYIEGVQDIVTKLIATYHGEADTHWWNQVMHIDYVEVGSGGDTVEYVDGWILHFFGIYERTDAERIGNNFIDVPVKIDNQRTKQKKTVHMVGGFGGVHAMDSDGRKALRPQTSMIVYYDPTSEEDKNAAEEHFS